MINNPDESTTPDADSEAAGASVDTLIDGWVEAERTGNQGWLIEFLAEDFRGTGPHGFTLTKSQWIARFDEPFTVASLTLDELDVEETNELILLTALQHQAATYRGYPSDGSFRISMVLRRAHRAAAWRILRAQLSGPLPKPPAGT